MRIPVEISKIPEVPSALSVKLNVDCEFVRIGDIPKSQFATICMRLHQDHNCRCLWTIPTVASQRPAILDGRLSYYWSCMLTHMNMPPMYPHDLPKNRWFLRSIHMFAAKNTMFSHVCVPTFWSVGCRLGRSPDLDAVAVHAGLQGLLAARRLLEAQEWQQRMQQLGLRQLEPLGKDGSGGRSGWGEIPSGKHTKSY